MDDKYNLTKEEVSRVPKSSGIYKIHAGFSFPRLKGETDVLYIGKANNLKFRLNTFIRGKGRNALPRFEQLQKSGFQLSFSYRPCLDPKFAEVQELLNYEQEHLELPPLNHSS